MNLNAGNIGVDGQVDPAMIMMISQTKILPKEEMNSFVQTFNPEKKSQSGSIEEFIGLLSLKLSMLEYYAKRAKITIDELREKEIHEIVCVTDGYAKSITRDIKEKQSNKLFGKNYAAFFHDISNSFTAVVGFTQIAVILCETKDYSKLRESFDMIQKCVEITSQQVGQEQMIENLDNSQAQSIQEIISTAIIVGRARRQKVNDIKIAMDVPPEPIMIRKNKTNWARVLMNLLCNAADSFSDKEDSENKNFIHVQARIINETIEISVTDNGIGMDDQVRSHMFDSRFTTKGEKGSGIGLHFCKEFVEHSGGGRIWAVSEVGVGTVFYISIPLANVQ